MAFGNLSPCLIGIGCGGYTVAGLDKNLLKNVSDAEFIVDNKNFSHLVD